MTGHLLGYARVSTKKQNLDPQIEALVSAGVDRQHVFFDKQSGVKRDREGLAELIKFARPGDTIVITALDRLGRSLSHMVRTIEQLQERDINLRSLREHVDFDTPGGRLQAAIFLAMAEYERELIRERATVAREAAAASGKPMGRKPKLTTEQKAMARTLHEAGTDYGTIARQLGCSRATIYRAVEGTVSDRPQMAS